MIPYDLCLHAAWSGGQSEQTNNHILAWRRRIPKTGKELSLTVLLSNRTRISSSSFCQQDSVSLFHFLISWSGLPTLLPPASFEFFLWLSSSLRLLYFLRFLIVFFSSRLPLPIPLLPDILSTVPLPYRFPSTLS